MDKKKLSMRLAVLLVLACILGAGAAYSLLAGRGGSQTVPPPGASVAVEDRSTVPPQPLPSGFLVWSSNRFGNHDILLMTLPDQQIRRITRHSHTEYFPRIAPDGCRIVFARSQKTWVSQRDPVSWDVVLVDLASCQEQLVAGNGNVPTWSADGRKVYFQRDSSQFVEHDLASGRERVVFAAGRGDLKKGTELQTPILDGKSGRLAVTLRRAQRMTALVDKNHRVKPIGKGCQLSWSPDGTFVYWIDKPGLQKNGLYRQDLQGGGKQLWLDLPEPLSHEYFPRLSADTSWLVLGASGGGHEHDSADYEIFLWKTGTPSTAAVRLTYHSGNDNWPDIFLQAR